MSVTIRFDGAEVAGRDGQSIAGILLSHGTRTWRVAGGTPRGILCGIGICQDCLVTVNAVAGVRACQRTAEDGDVVCAEPAS